MWKTREYWKDGQGWVVLLYDGVVLAEMTLERWATLPPTVSLLDDARAEAREELRREVLGIPD